MTLNLDGNIIQIDIYGYLPACQQVGIDRYLFGIALKYP